MILNRIFMFIFSWHTYAHYYYCYYSYSCYYCCIFYYVVCKMYCTSTSTCVLHFKFYAVHISGVFPFRLLASEWKESDSIRKKTQRKMGKRSIEMYVQCICRMYITNWNIYEWKWDDFEVERVKKRKIPHAHPQAVYKSTMYNTQCLLILNTQNTQKKTQTWTQSFRAENYFVSVSSLRMLEHTPKYSCLCVHVSSM